MTDTPAHAWLLPRLRALLDEADIAGISREVAVAVLADLIEGPEFNGGSGLPTSETDRN
jgi:hypothetical protein